MYCSSCYAEMTRTRTIDETSYDQWLINAKSSNNVERARATSARDLYFFEAEVI